MFISRDNIAWTPEWLETYSKILSCGGSPESFRPALAGCHLLSGGMGGLGLITAQWLVHEGADRLLLLSRSGTPADEELFELLCNSPVEV